LEDNDIFANGDTGVAILEGFPTLRNNRIHKNASAGVNVSGSARGTLEDNDILANGEVGVVITGEGADPSWWKDGDMMKVLPTPAQVRAWWGDHDPPPNPPNHPNQANHPSEKGEEPRTYADSDDLGRIDHSVIIPDASSAKKEGVNHNQRVINEELISGNGLPKRDTGAKEEVIRMISGSEGQGEGLARNTPGECIHDFPDGKGCFLCDPNHPYRIEFEHVRGES
jgi:parallel beta-helix repeat protein